MQWRYHPLATSFSLNSPQFLALVGQMQDVEGQIPVAAIREFLLGVHEVDLVFRGWRSFKIARLRR